MITTAVVDNDPAEVSRLAWISAWACSVPAPSRATLIFAAVKVRSPELAPVALVVHATNSSRLSSQISAALSDVPRSMTIPASPEGVPVTPFPSSNSLSAITVFVVLSVVVVPSTVRLPSIQRLPELSIYAFSASSAKPNRIRSWL